MTQNMEPTSMEGKASISRRRFAATESIALNETSSPMKSGQEGFAYVPLADPVELEIDNVPYTVARNVFESSTKWKAEV
jgi:hypothetical protein